MRRNPFTGAMQQAGGTPEVRTGRVFEIELRNTTIETWEQRPERKARRATMRFATETEAAATYVKIVRRKRAQGFREAGPTVVLGGEAPIPSGGGSTLLIDERFASGDGVGLLEEVLACTAERKLADLAKPWFEDVRRAMRRALLAYVDDGCDRPHHKGLVKRLFKLAEGAGDDEAMAHFMVAFDRLMRRFAVARDRRATGDRAQVVELAWDPLVPTRATKAAGSTRFSRLTRTYLARRAFRYFRRLGARDRARYGNAMRLALPLYRDAHLASSTRLLDAWGLLHALYAFSPVLLRWPRGVRVAPGRTLGELTPAPYYPDAHRGAFGELLEMLAHARSRTVRTWTIAWLRQEYEGELDGVDVTLLLPLFASEEDEVAAFAAGLLRKAHGLETLPLDAWLSLLGTRSVEVLPVVCDAFVEHVSPRRVTFAQCIDLACSRAASVAELGLAWARDKESASAGEVDLALVARLANAPIESVRRAGATWLLELAPKSPQRLERLRDLFDARAADVRALAIAHLETRAERAGDEDLPLWFALLESPYPDVRALVATHARTWQASAGADELAQLGSAVLLAVQGGSNVKRPILTRLAERLTERPAEADRLLPVMAFALRSVRPAERAGALAAITRAVLADESLRAAAQRHLPELAIGTQVSA